MSPIFKPLRKKWFIFLTLLLINSAVMASFDKITTFLVAPDESKIYTIGGEENNRSKVLRITEVTTGRLIKKIPLPLVQSFSWFHPNLAITPDGMKLYIIDIDKKLYFVDILSGEVTRIKGKPKQDRGREVSSAMTMSSDGQRLYIADGVAQLHSPAVIHVIDTSTNSVLTTVPGEGGWFSGSSALDNNSSHLYILNRIDEYHGEISILDLPTNHLEQSAIKIDQYVNSIAVNEINGLLYVTGRDCVYVVDPLKRKIVDTISIYTNGQLHSITFALNGEKFYLVNSTGTVDSGVVSFNTVTKQRQDISLSAFSDQAQIHASIDGTKMYVSNGLKNIINIIDVTRDVVMQKIEIPS